MNNEKKCPECGFSSEGDTCLNCGGELIKGVPLKQICPRCSHPATQGKKFCQSCGFNFYENTAEIPPRLPTAIHQPPAIRPAQKNQPFIIVSIVLLTGIIAGILIFLLTKNNEPATAMTENPGSKLTRCESNIKNLATACEMFAQDNKGHYPESLEELVEKNYIKEVPLCPSSEKPYIYSFQVNPDFFLIKCGEKNTHIDTGSVSEGYYPVYNPSDGLVLRGNYKTSLKTETSTPIPKKEPEVLPSSATGPSTWRGTIDDATLILVIYEKYNDTSFKGKNKIYWPEKACSSIIEGEVYKGRDDNLK